MDEYQIELQPIGRRGPCPAGESLLESARRLGVELISVCGGIGKCKSCKIQVMEGRFSDLTPSEVEAFNEEEVKNGWRLACKTYAQSDCKVCVPPESLSTAQRLQVEGIDIDIPLDPPIISVTCMTEPPSLSNPIADAENLLRKIGSFGPLDVDINVLRNLSSQLREWNWILTAHIRNHEVIAVSPTYSQSLGLAVDLGSTKIAGYLIDLDTGKKLASHGMMNPQIAHGEDIISRITIAVRSKNGQCLLADLAREAIMKLAQDLCAKVGASTEEILEVVIVGNTAMHHLILGLPVDQLARSPFVPAISGDLHVKARDIGLKFAPGAYVYFPPNIAGFVGPDHVAVLAATSLEWSKGNTIVLDIGTNTEISLIGRGKITSTSCPSGPAFEGYHIKDGVRAAPGAIEKVWIVHDGVNYKTIDNADPIGICGSGILDAVSQLHLVGVLNKGGRMLEGSHARVVHKNDHLEFILASKAENFTRLDISITQKDVREVQLGKAAIQAALKILAESQGISHEEVDKVIIAGAFGSYIDISNAISIGMLPSLPLSKFHQVGNAAGIGAKLYLMSSAKRKEVGDLLSRITYLELAVTREFSKAFTRACLLGPYHLSPSTGQD